MALRLDMHKSTVEVSARCVVVAEYSGYKIVWTTEQIEIVVSGFCLQVMITCGESVLSNLHTKPIFY